ncbi:hypothetical protein GC176_14655 [bacterium]|nr:hypothetical protein [bacterium]
MSHSKQLTTVCGLLLAAVFFLIGTPALAQSTAPATPVTTQPPPVTTDFILLLDARQTMAANTNTSGNPYERLQIAVAAANTAVQAIPVGTNLGIVILQDNVRTLRPLSPLRPTDRQHVQTVLSKLTATGHSPMHLAIQHLRDHVLLSHSKSNVFLLLMSDGNDTSFSRTLTETGTLKNKTASMRSVMLATYVSDDSLDKLQKMAQAIHPDDNAHHVLHHGDLPTGLLPLQLACDAIDDHRLELLASTGSALSDSRRLVGRLQNQLATLQQVEANRDQLRRQLDAITQAEATQRTAATRLSNRISTLEAQKAQADKAVVDLKAARQADQLAALKLQADLDVARSALTTSRADLQKAVSERDALHGKVVADVEAKRGLESDLKAAQVQANLLTQQLNTEQELKKLKEERKAGNKQGPNNNADEQTKAILSAINSNPFGQLFEYFWAQLLGVLGVVGTGGYFGWKNLLSKVREIDSNVDTKLSNQEQARHERVNSLAGQLQAIHEILQQRPARLSDPGSRFGNGDDGISQPQALAVSEKLSEITAELRVIGRQIGASTISGTAKRGPSLADLKLVNGIGSVTARELVAAGIENLAQLSAASDDELRNVPENLARVQKWREEAGWIVAIAKATGSSREDAKKAFYGLADSHKDALDVLNWRKPEDVAVIVKLLSDQA